MDYDWTVMPRTCFYKLPHHEYLITDRYKLRGHELPAGYGYDIFVADNGRCIGKSKPGSNGGIRYYHFFGEDAQWKAMDHGMAWARRWQKQLKREANGERRRGF